MEKKKGWGGNGRKPGNILQLVPINVGTRRTSCHHIVRYQTQPAVSPWLDWAVPGRKRQQIAQL